MKSLLSIALAILMATVVFGCPKTPPETVSVAPEFPAEVAPAAVTPVPDAVKEMAANFSKVFFEFDAAGLTSSAQQALGANVRIMMDNNDLKIEIQGHADERGTTDYNLALGDRRANAVKEYLAGAGVGPSRLTVVSYGEELPAADGSNERAWSQNRRAEFVVTWGGEGGVEGTAK